MVSVEVVQIVGVAVFLVGLALLLSPWLLVIGGAFLAAAPEIARMALHREVDRS